MINDDATHAKPRTRRMLPAVGEVMREASARSTAEPEVVFRAARQVCSDELRRIKDGHESAPIETLVQRALDLLRSAAPGTSRPAEEEVFTETTGALDLRWEGEAKRSAPPGSLAAAAQAPPSVPLATHAPAAPAEAEEAPFAPAAEPLDVDAAPVPAVAEPFLLDQPAEVLRVARPEAPVEPLPAPPEAPPPTFEIDFGAVEGPTTVLSVLPPAETPPAVVPALAAEAATTILPVPVPVPAVELPIPAPPPAPEEPAPPAPSPESLAMLSSEPFTEPLTASLTGAREIGEDTLSRLSREAESVDLASVLPGAAPPPEARPGRAPKPAPDLDMPYAIVVPGARHTGLSEEERFERSDLVSGAVPESGGRRWPIVAAAAGVVAAAALGWYVFGLLKAPPAPPAPPAPMVAERTARPAATPVPATPEPVTAVPAATVAEPETAAPPPAKTPEPAPAATPRQEPPAPEPVTRIAVPVPKETPKPAPSPGVTRIELPKPSPVAVQPIATAPPPTKSPASVAPAAAPASVARQGRAAPLASPDWAGREPVFALHFSSYPDRKTAEKDAASIARKLGAPVYAVGIDLGAKGVWYRVMAGEFRSFEEAQAFRDDVIGKGSVEKVGFVYRLEGAKAAPPGPQ